jgi:methylglutaconyl-CoA hydratase
VHQVVDENDLDKTVASVVRELGSCGPNAVAAAKTLIARVSAATYDETRGITAAMIAKQRASEEGQEGLHAFLERRPASFVHDGE